MESCASGAAAEAHRALPPLPPPHIPCSPASSLPVGASITERGRLDGGQACLLTTSCRRKSAGGKLARQALLGRRELRMRSGDRDWTVYRTGCVILPSSPPRATYRMQRLLAPIGMRNPGHRLSSLPVASLWQPRTSGLPRGWRASCARLRLLRLQACSATRAATR